MTKKEEHVHEFEKTTEPVIADNPEYRGGQKFITYLSCECGYKEAIDYGDKI